MAVLAAAQCDGTGVAFHHATLRSVDQTTHDGGQPAACRGSQQDRAALCAARPEASLRQIERRLKRLQSEARELVTRDAELEQRYTLLRSIPGIGESSALQILGELEVLAPDLDVRQWVAHSGLDPMHHTSRSSVHRAARI